MRMEERGKALKIWVHDDDNDDDDDDDGGGGGGGGSGGGGGGDIWGSGNSVSVSTVISSVIV